MRGKGKSSDYERDLMAPWVLILCSKHSIQWMMTFSGCVLQSLPKSQWYQKALMLILEGSISEEHVLNRNLQIQAGCGSMPGIGAYSTSLGLIPVYVLSSSRLPLKRRLLRLSRWPVWCYAVGRWWRSFQAGRSISNSFKIY